MICGKSFLEKCDPRAKLVSLFLIMPILLSHPMFSWHWGVAAGLSMLSMATGLTSLLASLARQLLRLRWLFAALLIFHVFFTPGQPLWDGWDFPTKEGLHEGLQQTVRLIFVVSLSWTLVRTTTPWQLLSGLYRLFGGLEKLGIPVKKGFTIMAFSMGCIPHFVQEARWVGEDLGLRILHTTQSGWRSRLQRTAQGGETLLFRLFLAARCQEEALRARGFAQGLPFSIFQKTTLGWRDLLLLVLPTAIFLGIWLEKAMVPKGSV